MSNEVNDKAISTLIGKPSRVYTTGDRLTEDFIPDRVNIELSESGKIVKIWIG
ncbi:I78 family peptidase inhibitor [Agaribacterium haliotis]|uniref:I78 family peptidase inhibitor n=1 Tax=Agaribacterium haliotis TaxID=2013869 RepID=UPI000BB5312E|nr:I78 family peptidase inhibitor [Agaribacterium haliotis]